ncbi:hypothetical protein D7S86_16025 [Pararobbsia silviterrae]|uniref:Rieske domain-containing protein n=2 Tax=Pararobbsia silviterrae TaxID=1792498 RepID=A0A494XVA1_9BURK|nr:hypothetical protein D7S86_16025 [Pararobbsia silviterrae]
MGALLRTHWHPAVRAERLIADGAPVRVRLLGQDFVAFRATDGRVGFFDEACPHRRTSLALARNEGNGLRCIFHGWKFDVSGKTVDIPTEPPHRCAALMRDVPLRHYPVRERGGVIWVYLGDASDVAPFPDFEFTALPDAHVEVRVAIVHCNWFQGLEAVLDSAHLGVLHRGQLDRKDTGHVALTQGVATNFSLASRHTSPRFEIAPTAYGFREAALRELDDGQTFAKIREFVAPYYSFLPGFPEIQSRRMLVAAVPIDDEWCAQWCIYYRLDQPFEDGEIEARWQNAGPDKNNFYDRREGPSTHWGQDRAAMAAGHFSGFPGRHIYEEDFVVQEAMGPIVDRTREYLGSSDKVIIHTRRAMIGAARALQAGRPGWGRPSSDIDYRAIRACAVFLPPGQAWQGVDARILGPNQRTT